MTLDASELKQQLFQLSQVTRKIIQQTIAPVCEKHQLTLQQFQIMAELDAESCQTTGQLSDRAGILKTNFAAVSRKLEIRNLVARRKNEDDQRVFTLSLTESGQMLMNRINQEINEKVNASFKTESAQSLNEIARGLDALNNFFNKLYADGQNEKAET